MGGAKNAAEACKRCQGCRGCKNCNWFRNIDKKPYCFCPVMATNEVKADYSVRLSLSAGTRRRYDEAVMEFLRGSRQRLEAFVDLDYFGAGADACWAAAGRKLSRMSNVAVVKLYHNIQHEDLFEEYYSLFSV